MNTVIEGYFAGDDLDIERDVVDVTVSDPLIKAWLTVKTSATDPDPGVVQKIITTTPITGVGQIAQDGSVNNGNGTASMRFELTKTDTAALGSTVRYYYDVQVKTSAGKIYTPDEGFISFVRGVTDATS